MSKLNLLLLGLILSPYAFAETPTPAKLLAYNCFNCHGDNGVSKGGVPSIKGLPANIIELHLKNYRDGTQVSTVMGRIAKGLNDDEIKELSAFIATLK